VAVTRKDVYDAFSLAASELFNPATGTFTATGVMTEVRYSHTATLLKNGKVLLTGGFNGQPVQDAELFDPTTVSFSRTGLMDSARANHTATVLNDGTMLVAGGLSFFDPDGGLAAAEVFDPTANIFTPTGPLGTARFLHTATRLSDGVVLITGGQTKITAVFTKSAELYK
jgi:hypothetical protein